MERATALTKIEEAGAEGERATLKSTQILRIPGSVNILPLIGLRKIEEGEQLNLIHRPL